MRQGTAASLSAIWERYPTTDAARAAIRAMYHDDRVLRAFIVTRRGAAAIRRMGGALIS
jgi:hypothetical protein